MILKTPTVYRFLHQPGADRQTGRPTCRPVDAGELLAFGLGVATALTAGGTVCGHQ
ncbi:hypothetical protein DFAR_3990032 [Desulfarculales bacterium]